MAPDELKTRRLVVRRVDERPRSERAGRLPRCPSCWRGRRRREPVEVRQGSSDRRRIVVLLHDRSVAEHEPSLRQGDGAGSRGCRPRPRHRPSVDCSRVRLVRALNVEGVSVEVEVRVDRLDPTGADLPRTAAAHAEGCQLDAGLELQRPRLRDSDPDFDDVGFSHILQLVCAVQLRTRRAGGPFRARGEPPRTAECSRTGRSRSRSRHARRGRGGCGRRCP